MTSSDCREAPSNHRPAGSAAEAQPVCWPLVTAQEMRELDRHAIETLGVPAGTLMENAGRAVAEELLRELPNGAKVSIVCGRGNNGGDGLVAARHLHQLGVDVLVVLLGDVANLSADAADNLDRACRVGVPLADHAGSLARGCHALWKASRRSGSNASTRAEPMRAAACESFP